MELNIDSAVSQLTTIRDWLRWTTSRFHEGEIALGHGSDSYWDEAVFLVLQALHLPPMADNRVLGARLTMPERYQVAEWVSRRVINREPLPYIAQAAWQEGLSFYVDQRVLIPRSPIAQILSQLEPWSHRWLNHQPSRIMDMCTGSGCLAILSAMVFSDTQVDAVDISADALTLASINIAKYKLEEQVRLVQSDSLSQIPEGLEYDLILCNPPYVDLIEMNSLPAEYRYEPVLALASGDDGLEFTRQFLRHVGAYLSEIGVLLLEVGHSYKALEENYPDFAFTWLELEDAVGVCVLTKLECDQIAGMTPVVSPKEEP